MYQHHLPPRQTMQPRNYHPSPVARRLSPTNFNLNANTYGGNGVGSSNHDAAAWLSPVARRPSPLTATEPNNNNDDDDRLRGAMPPSP